MFDLNTVEPQRSGDLIPDGTYAKIGMSIRRGGMDGGNETDRGLLKASKNSDVLMIDAEFTVMEGPSARQKFWQYFTVQGGTLDEQGASKAGQISLRTFRSMIDSACGLDPADTSDAARAKRVLNGLADLDGIQFVARIGVEESLGYADKNTLDAVILPTAPEWRQVMNGEAVPPKPSKKKSAQPAQQSMAPAWGAAVPAAATPSATAWQQQAAPAAQTASAATPPAAAPAAAAQPAPTAQQTMWPSSPPAQAAAPAPQAPTATAQAAPATGAARPAWLDA